MNQVVQDSKPHGPYKFNVSGVDIYAASIDAVRELYREGMKLGYNDVWNAYIESKGEKQDLMKEGSTLINMETGHPEYLEEKVRPKEQPPKGQLDLKLS